MLFQAIEEILSDKGFQLPSPLAADALHAASVLLTWCQDPNNQHDFTNSLHSKLHKAFDGSARKFQRRREKMWESYHAIQCSDGFVQLWKRFLALPSCEPSPILFQNITDRIFRMMIKVALPIGEASSTSTSTETPSPLTHTELNALLDICEEP